MHLGPTSFNDSAACLGKQLEALLLVISQIHPCLTWYVADVQTTGYQIVSRREPTPMKIGDTAALIKVAARIDQFESGVIGGIPDSIVTPRFRNGGLWTDDDEDEALDLGDALVEIRAFDTTYWAVLFSNTDLLRRLTSIYKHEMT